jgi:hypothetical protein
MVRHWLRLRNPGWGKRLAINGFGALVTSVVLAIVIYEKFFAGAYLVVILIPVLVGIMLFIHRHYAASTAQLAIDPTVVVPPPQRDDRVIVPVTGINRAIVQAVNIGRSIGPDVRAVIVSDDGPDALRKREEWDRRIEDVPLDIIETEAKILVEPILAYLDHLDAELPDGELAPMTFVIVPEFVPRHWWERGLYNQSARRLRAALIGRPHTVVVDMPYRRSTIAPAVGTAGTAGTAAIGSEGPRHAGGPRRKAPAMPGSASQ